MRSRGAWRRDRWGVRPDEPHRAICSTLLGSSIPSLADSEGVRIGDRIRIGFDRASDTLALPRFSPDMQALQENVAQQEELR